MRKPKKTIKALTHIFLIIGCLITLYPLIWMTFSSFKSTGTVMSLPPTLLPKEWTIENYKTIFSDNIGTYFFNSVYISIIRTILPVYTSALLGYVFAKFTFKGKDAVFTAFISTMMVPWIVTIIPQYNLFNKAGLLDNHLALILPFICSSYGIFLVRSFMHQVPTSLMESARIDGCGEFKIFNRIVFPLIAPATAALGIILFLTAWDDYLWPFLVINSDNLYTLTVGLSKYAFKHYTIAYGSVIAGSVISIMPVIVVYIILQKYIIAGITIGGVKG